MPAGPLDVAPGDYLPSTVSAALALCSVMEGLDDPDLLPALHDVEVAVTGEVVMNLAREIELRLGEPTELKQKLMVAGTIIQQYLRDGRRIEYVDASVPDRVAVNAE